MREKISPALVGRRFSVPPLAWAEKDVLLYALAVGAKPARELDFLYEARGPKVLPTFCVAPGLNVMMGAAAQIDMNLAMILHGEQSFMLHRPIPASCEASGEARIVDVWDKGKAAVLAIETTLADKDGPIYTGVCTLFVRGAGGFGGERGPSAEDTKIEVPARDPDFVVSETTDNAQSALYRLCGDRNPIHIDPMFAQFAGYPTAFLHGLCTYGFAGRAALQALCGGDASRFQGMQARFADVVYNGDMLITKLWVTEPGVAVLQVETQKGNVVMNNARVRYLPA